MVLVIGLTTYLLISSNILSSFNTLFQKDLSKATDQKNANVDVEEEIEELKKEELGPDQERLISMFGYPDQFIIIFDEGNNNKRIDTKNLLSILLKNLMDKKNLFV